MRRASHRSARPLNCGVSRNREGNAAPVKNKADIAVAICAATFVVVLAISAYWDRSIRALHFFEAMPYVVAGVLCLRQIKFGYALGVVSGIFWLWMAGFLTTFVRNGFERLAMFMRTGTVDRPDLLIAVPAAIAAGGLVLFAVLGYAQRPSKSWSDVLSWVAAVAVVPLFFLGIFAAFAPQYLAMFESVF
jgi:hypothetical protein